MRLELTEVVQATGGTLASSTNVDLPTFGAVTIDSRRVAAGDLFVALRGQTYDGHDFVAAALARGARAAIVDHIVSSVEPSVLIVVDDTLKALGDLAAFTRARSPMKVVAITGSNGKTTTKEMVAAICNVAVWPPPFQRILKTEGNLNNLIGLPLTLLRMTGDEAVGVLEMGMNQPGEIARLTEIARPDFGVVLNIGRAHLQGVGGLAGVAAAKGELFEGLRSDAVIAVNVDDPWVVKIAERFPGRKVRFGSRGEVEARNIVDFGFDGVGFELVIEGTGAKVRLRMIGLHNVKNALAAAALGHAMELPIDVIAKGLLEASPPPMRMQAERLANGVVILNDAYNANPSSVEAALEALRRIPGRLVVVLGAMWELGDEGRRAHREIGERVASLGADLLVTVGDLGEVIATGAVDAGMAETAVSVCATHQEAADAVMRNRQAGDVVLVKGSRGMKMEEVIRLLRGAAGAP
jgi:UDP-N-acetylmuramoyl-tripeptide--D-alanyl-D-alanine ligase